MTDVTEASILPAAWGAANDVEREAFRPMLEQRHGKLAVDLAIAKASQPLTGDTPGAAMPALNSPGNRDNLNQSQAIEMADALFAAASARIRAAGEKSKLPETAIEAQIAEYQTMLQETMARDHKIVPTKDVPEVRSQDEIAFDEALAPPDDPVGYELKFSRERSEGGDISELRALRDEFASAFHAMALPTASGQGLMTAMLDAADQFEATKEHDRPQRWAGIRASIERNVPLGTTWADIQKNVKLAWDKIPNGEFKTELMRNGSLDSVVVITQLFRQGERIAEKARLVAARPKPTK